MRRWKYLSVRKRFLIGLAVILVLAGLIWVMLGYPALTREGYLRRAEKAYLLPQGDILVEINTDMDQNRLLVAAGSEYVEILRLPELWEVLNTWDMAESFNLYKKEGDLTAILLPYRMYQKMDANGTVIGCMLLVDERPEVQSVELDFSFYTFKKELHSYTAEAEREVGGVFACYFEMTSFMYYKDMQWWETPEFAGCSAKLYDKNGALIEETEVPIEKLIA